MEPNRTEQRIVDDVSNAPRSTRNEQRIVDDVSNATKIDRTGSLYIVIAVTIETDSTNEAIVSLNE